MRVVVNQLVTAGLKTGVGHYTLQLVRALRSLPALAAVGGDPPAALRFLKKLWGRRAGVGAAPGAPASSSLLRRHASEWARSLGRCLCRGYARWAYTSRRFDLYHEPNFIPLPCDLPTIATVHDLSALLHPEWHPPERVRYFEKHFQRELGRCAHLLAISESARQEIIRTLGIAPERISRTWMGVRSWLKPLPREEVRPVLGQLGLPGEYLLHVGTIEPRKNVLRLLRAYCGLPAGLRRRWPLLLVGGWGWRTEEVAEYYHAQARHKGVRHVGYVAEAHLAAVYNGARALLSPSLYEGFGLPPVEMLATGGAVLASRIGPHQETCGSAACLVEPEDEGSWHDALRRVLTDDGWHQELRSGAVEAAEPFTWERCAADTLRAYHAALNRQVTNLPPRKAA
jgi:alpha-1,3-rhamnosyl/mannosyltransferase